jgi:hypothetical protein
VFAILSARVAFASWRARDTLLRLGRRTLTTAETRAGADEPSWRIAERDGEALQRGALILQRGEVPGAAPLEYGRAVAAQASLDRARRLKRQTETKLREGGWVRWVRFVLGLVLIATLLLLWYRPHFGPGERVG